MYQFIINFILTFQYTLAYGYNVLLVYLSPLFYFCIFKNGTASSIETIIVHHLPKILNLLPYVSKYSFLEYHPYQKKFHIVRINENYEGLR